MKTILITGSGGLVGGESALFFLSKGYKVIGIDNNMRNYFFGQDGNVDNNINDLSSRPNYTHHNIDIRYMSLLEDIFKTNAIDCIIHAAAQPSHDWAAKEPFTDFNINATSTLNLLELTRKYSPEATFIFMSTNKVYGDGPNNLNLWETETRFELFEEDPWYNGIDESFSIDQCKHSLFGCSKLAADVYVQEYGRYFGMKTTVFRGGCLTGARHKGAQLHGFLNYLVKCNLNQIPYTIFGYKGKQVRDNIHASDLVEAFYEVIQYPRMGEVYNIGGSRFSNCSIIEATKMIENFTGIPMLTKYVDTNRSGDHIWWISDIRKFQIDYPKWELKYTIQDIIKDIIEHI